MAGKKKSEQIKPEQIEKVLLLLPTMSVRQACLKIGMSDTAFRSHINNDIALRARYMEGRDSFHNKMFDDLMALITEDLPTDSYGRIDSALVQQRRLKADTIKWALSKLQPQKYGERLTLAGDADAPLAITKIERVVTKPKKDKKIDDHV
jgi:hypothetical protein